MKERIIGAAILVSFVVLVVPIFLDGPPGENEIVSERVLLPGQDEQKTQTVVLERNRTDPVPLNSNATSDPDPVATAAPDPVASDASASTAQQAEKPPAAQKVIESAPIPQVKPQPAASTTGMWAVQLGSFSNKDNAEKLAADLRKQGYAAFLSQLATDSGQLHRVRIGPQKDRDSAEAVAQRLAKVGHKGQVVPHP
ncbi:MAG: SPOR domain-containing protein [Gammaproteobacteria bacterium]|nr:SPOR domain-containing protein [Gammaproteobacteria bacterium]